MTRRWRLASLSVLVVLSVACENRPRPESAGVGPAAPPRATSGLTREEARDSARAFMARSSAAGHVFLDSSAVEQVDSLWRVTFRRRQLVVPNVVTVDVHARTRAMRFPGDE